MPDFGLVAHALLSPSQCIACRGHADPQGFVDLVAELPGYGRVYVCAGCLGMAAGRLGWIEPRVAQGLAEGLRAAEAHGRELTMELERANGRGGWVWKAEEILSGGMALEVPADDPELLRDLTICPDCGGDKTATSKRCRSCSSKVALAARQTKATA